MKRCSCSECIYCWKIERYTGKNASVREVIWRCLKRKGKPVLYKARYVYGKKREERRLTNCCDEFTPYPWRVSKTFESWIKEGIKLPSCSKLWEGIRMKGGGRRGSEVVPVRATDTVAKD